MSAGVRAGLVAVLSGALASGLLVVPASPAGATGGSVSMTTSSPTVAPGSTVDLTAGVPVSDAGTLAQEIVQTIDPTKVKLTAASDITYPAGWTLQVSTDGTTYTSTLPTTTAGWAAVRGVKAYGSIVSDGSNSGRQVASRTSTGVLLGAGNGITTSGTGDGWDVFFDPDYTRVFNRPHHAFWAHIDCHWLRTENGHTGGASCWPQLGDGLYRVDGFTPFLVSSDRSTGWVDGQQRLWGESVNTTTGVTLSRGFYCVDVSGASPQPCAVGGWFGLDDRIPSYATGTRWNEVMGIAAVDGKVFTQSQDGLLCLDTRAAGGPVACPGQPYRLSAELADPRNGDLKVIGGKLYVLRRLDSGTYDHRLGCIDPARIVSGATGYVDVKCSGWPTSPVYIGGVRPLVAVPNAAGSLIAVCTVARFQNRNAEYEDSDCLDLETGSSTVVGLPSGVEPFLIANGLGYGNGHGFTKIGTLGTRIYLPTLTYGTSIRCFDTSTNAACAPNAQINTYGVYSVDPDPINPCIWTNGDDGRIRLYDAVTLASGCTGTPPMVSFPADAAVPRMACTANSGIQQWVDFRIAGIGAGAQWTGARLTVRDPTGAVLSGWQDVTIPSNGVLDLSSLPVSGGSGGSAWVGGGPRLPGHFR